jgi:DNA-binding MarR family transcriptional regulator
VQNLDNRIDKLVTRFSRIVGLFNRLDSRPYEFGEGERLFRSELHALRAIGREEGRTVTELGSAFGITKGAVSQIISKLVTKGYLLKERNPDCGKELLLSLSDRGKAAFKAHETLHHSIDKQLLAAMEPISLEELARFDVLLGRIEGYMRSIAE